MSSSSSRPPRALSTRLARGFAACSSQAAVYGQCVVGHIDNISRGVCEREFAALQQCVKQHVSDNGTRNYRAALVETLRASSD